MSTAGIATKFWESIHCASPAGGEIVAVASRDAARAQAWADERFADMPLASGKPDALGSYAELLAREDVDAIYIALPTTMRQEWLLKAFAAGKHVLGEKPTGPTAADMAAVAAAAKASGRLFMDGTMFMHSARLDAVRGELDGGAIGDVKRIVNHFSFGLTNEADIRINGELEPLGVVGDLGWYCVRFALWVMDFGVPTAVRGMTRVERGGVPADFDGSLVFANPTGGDSITATFSCSFNASFDMTCAIVGTKGTIRLDDFVLPYEDVAFDVSNPVTTGRTSKARGTRRVVVDEAGNEAASSQASKMLVRFSDLVAAGDAAAFEPWAAKALATQRVLDALMASAKDGGKEVAVA